MVGEPRISRRSLVAGGAGIALGGGWAAALQATTLPDHPSLAVVGASTSQVALLDATAARALILLGPLSDALLDQLPAMLTTLRQRIDVVIGAEAVLGALGSGFAGRWAVQHRLLVPTTIGGDHAPDSAHHTTVTRDITLELDPNLVVELRVTPRQEWRATDAGAGTVWCATIRHAGNVIVLAPDTTAAAELGPIRPSLAIAPGDDPEELATTLQPGSIAANAAYLDEKADASKVVRLRIFPEDVARVELHVDGVRLPPWAG
jgi:hypothetical protein